MKDLHVLLRTIEMDLQQHLQNPDLFVETKQQYLITVISRMITYIRKVRKILRKFLI